MRLNLIECNNFFNHKQTILDFSDIESPVLLTGNNGAGKSSSVSEALTYAIFGETRLNSADDAIRGEEDEMSVRIVFNLNGQDIEIIRSKKRGRTQKLDLNINSKSVGELMSETQVRINKLFGLSYNSFRSSVILRQEDADFFVNQKPDDRKKIIAEILDLNAYEQLEKIAREQRTELKAEIKVEKTTIDSIEIEDTAELQENVGKIKQFIVEIDEKIEVIEIEIDTVVQFNSKIQEYINKNEEIKQQNKKTSYLIDRSIKELKYEEEALDNYNRTINSYKDVSEFIAQSKRTIDRLDEQIFTDMESKSRKQQQHIKLCATEAEKFDKQITDLNVIRTEAHTFLKTDKAKLSKLQTLQQSTCPTCLRDINESEKQTIIDELVFEIDKQNNVLMQADKVLETLITKRNIIINGEFDKAKDLWAQIKYLEREIIEKTANKQNARKTFDEQLEIQHEYDSAINKRISAQENVKKNKRLISDLQKQLLVELVVPETKKSEHIAPDGTKPGLKKFQADRDKAIELGSQFAERIKVAKRNAKRQEELVAGIVLKTQRLGLLEKLCVAFSRKGIPAVIIETVLPEIEDISNQYLGRMSDGTLQLKFNTLEALKNGEQRETLNIEVHDGSLWRSFESYSGGEKFRVSLAIRLALSRVLAQRAGVELRLLILDEPASPLDPQGREIFCSTIKSLTSYFSNIIIISHLSDLREEFENRINITKAKE